MVICLQSALRMIYAWLMEPMIWKDVWSSVLMTLGLVSATTCGQPMMEMWPADSLATLK